MIELDKVEIKRKLKPAKNYFLALAKAIIYQQISTKAGDSIYKKFISLFGKKNPTPKLLLQFSEHDLRRAGLSKQKISYLNDLANKFLDKTIDQKVFKDMKDEEIKKHLIQVKGIGPWTADMFLIFALNRPNVLPIGDLGIVKGFQKAFRLKKTPNEKKMKKLSRPYEGSFTKFSLYLWQILD